MYGGCSGNRLYPDKKIDQTRLAGVTVFLIILTCFVYKMLKKTKWIVSIQSNAVKQNIILSFIHLVFGVDLTTVVLIDDDTVPKFLQQCIFELESRGLDIEGIYRVSGRTSHVMEVKDKADESEQKCILKQDSTKFPKKNKIFIWIKAESNCMKYCY